jgi:hypothetical protein
MCRLPLDIMHRIIGFVKQPLPEPDEYRVGPKDLAQNGLATLMRVSRVSKAASISGRRGVRLLFK